MGSGNWSSATYEAMTGARISSGTSFSYDRTAHSTGNYKAHESVDVTKTNSAGLRVRESRDSVEHPHSKPLVIAFDGTGSMGSVPRMMQSKLKNVFGLITAKGVKDVQIAVSVYGDAANNEKVPVQVSQFESDNRIDDALDNLFIEGNGGANNGETSNLLFYYLAHHTELDSLKRGVKGKLYVICDEKQIPITPAHVKKYIHDDQPLGDLSFEGIAADLTQKYDVTILLINNHAAKIQNSEKFYSDLFGPANIVNVQDPKMIPELIAGLFVYDQGVDAESITNELTRTAGKAVALRVGSALTNRGGNRVALR